MSQPIDYRQPSTDPSTPAGLMAYGIITLILAGLSACTAAATPLTLLAPAASPTGTANDPAMIGQAIAALVIYLGAAALLAVLGIGMVRGKRWVRPYVLALTVPALGFGVVAIIGVIWGSFVVTQADTVMPGNPTPANQQQFMLIGMIVTIVVGVLFALGLPLLYVLYFKRADVAETLERIDPNGFVGDHLPIPALALALWLAVYALSFLAGLANPTFPAITAYATGLVAAGMLVVVAAAMLMAAVLVWKRMFAGWVIAAVVVLAWSGATAVTPLIADEGPMETLRNNPQSAAIADAFADAPIWPLVVTGLLQLLLIIIGLLWARPHVAREAALPS
ncbi:MAG: hypothetical protein AAF656_04740 [Planctomycetota bacterium]